MGAVVAFPGTDGSSLSPSRSILPAWPHPRTVTFTIEQARVIDRDIHHLDCVMGRINDLAAFSAILAKASGFDPWYAEEVARRIGAWLRTGRTT